jgi:hypothetical protein
MQAMSGQFKLYFIFFIDIVQKYSIGLTVYLVVNHCVSDMFEVGSDLVEATCFWSGFDQTDLTNCRVGTGFDCSVFGLCRVGIGDDCLANIDLARAVFAQSIERLIDDP